MLPVAWLVIMLYALFIVAALPDQSLNGSGKIAFIKSVERKWWWASKCICITIIICASFLLLYGILFLQVLVSGGGASAGAGFGGDSGAVAWGFVLPVLVCISLAIAENTIALFLNPAAGYISAIVILVVSAYFKRGWLLGNYGMLARIQPYSENGLPPEAGLIWTGAVIALSIAAGAWKLRRSDLM